MKIELPPPLVQSPQPRTFWQDFKLLAFTQLRVTRNKISHWSPVTWISIAAMSIGLLSFLVYIGFLAYGTLGTMSPEIGRIFLSMLFMAGMVGLIFFGTTAAFATLYMSDDLELLFMSPASTRVVFAVKLLVVAGSNLFTSTFFAFIPAVFYGLLFGAEKIYYIYVLLTGVGLWITGTALAALMNLLIMRVVPAHRSREAVGVLGAVAGIAIAVVFQIPNMVIARGGSLNLANWFSAQQEVLSVMDYFPWGWGSLALAESAAGNHLVALGWSLLLLLLGTALFFASFSLVERGFRQGWVSLSQGEGGRRRKNVRKPVFQSSKLQDKAAWLVHDKNLAPAASLWSGMWSVAKKELLYLRRDTREWFGYMVPLIIMVFFIGQFLFMGADSAKASLVMVLIMYTIMFSGNMALQSFGREGEAEWVLNSVPLAGWPVVWGKLLAAALPTLILMEALLAGTAIAIGLSPSITLGLAVGAVFITLGSSAIGLFYSINNCRYNPDSPMHRISPGASLLMYLINLVFIGVLALGLAYLFPPAELMPVLKELPPLTFSWGFPDTILYIVYLLSRPLLFPTLPRVITGIVVSAGMWSAVFFIFVAATVRQSRKGFRVEIITTAKKKRARSKQHA